jgi:hypothetical protein
MGFVASGKKRREAAHQESGARKSCGETCHRLLKIPIRADTRQIPASRKARSFASRHRNIFDERKINEFGCDATCFAATQCHTEASALK